MNQHKNRVKNKRGFTLIEIMIVLGIIGLIFSFVGVNIMDNLKESRKKGAKIQIASFQQALQAYYLALNMYPHTSQGLEALVKKPSAGKVPENYPSSGFLGKKEIPKDPFGNPYRYECENYQDYTISSDGPDGEQGTDDDVRSE
ncbi:MAG: type II secretion system major pseudopilin GspG [Deltaproteobacteria bacterium]|nr:type II secretion system major pseudopilin GspG [Deltaproteobacteria bacterium]MBI3293838.1 type II secretion system major pseudopilin GspG [Deltaproteobacteria bacterium]